MKQLKDLLRYAGVILFFGLCITVLCGTVKASAADNEVKLNVTDISIAKDGWYRLKVYNLGSGQTVIYRSSNSSVAMVSRTGKIVGLSYGDAVITATVVDDGTPVAALQCSVTIGPAAVSIKLTKTSLVLNEGRQKMLTTVVWPLNTVETPVFYSSDTDIAKVSSAGRVRAVNAGSASVYAFLENGQYAVCNVTVLNDEDYEKYRAGMSVEEILGEESGAVEADDPESADQETDDQNKDNTVNEEPAGDENSVTGTPEPVSSNPDTEVAAGEKEAVNE